MKKLLLGTSAIALAGAFATQASAANWDVKVGGYYTEHFGYSHTKLGGGLNPTTSTQYNGVDFKQDTEIHFLPSITLDNGIKFGVNIQLEGNTSSDQIDESYMIIKGSFGELNLGSENSAGYKMLYTAPDVSLLGHSSSSLSAYIPYTTVSGENGFFRGSLGSNRLENMANNDSQRATYYTPRFSGFQFGVSYARDSAQDSSGQLNTKATTGAGSVHDIIDLGANYVNSFGDINVALSGTWGTATAEQSAGKVHPKTWALGGNLGFAGFTVGGSYAKQTKTGSANLNGHVWDAGVSYATGPWSFSIDYAEGKNQNDQTPMLDDKMQTFIAGANYDLAKGVSLGAFAGYVKLKVPDVAAGGVSGESSGTSGTVKGWVIGSGIALSF